MKFWLSVPIGNITLIHLEQNHCSIHKQLHLEWTQNLQRSQKIDNYLLSSTDFAHTWFLLILAPPNKFIKILNLLMPASKPLSLFWSTFVGINKYLRKTRITKVLPPNWSPDTVSSVDTVLILSLHCHLHAASMSLQVL